MLQDGELVAQRQDLDVFVDAAHRNNLRKVTTPVRAG
jgi:hypothetical protein